MWTAGDHTGGVNLQLISATKPCIALTFDLAGEPARNVDMAGGEIGAQRQTW